jgi:hypothetical protein
MEVKQHWAQLVRGWVTGALQCKVTLTWTLRPGYSGKSDRHALWPVISALTFSLPVPGWPVWPEIQLFITVSW